MKKLLMMAGILSAIALAPATARDLPLGFTETELTDQPNAFLAKKFTKDDGSVNAIFIAQAIDDGSFLEYSPDKLILKNVKDYLKCQTIDFKAPEDNEGDVYDGDIFKSCVTEDGKKYDGEVSVSGYFYTVAAYNQEMSDYDKDILAGTVWTYLNQVCAQDCQPSGKISKTAIVPGYISLPTFKTSLEKIPVIVSDTYINKQNGNFFSYQIIGPDYKNDDLLSSVSKFCEYQEITTEGKNKGDYNFTKCWKILLDHPNLISINVSKYPKFTLITMHEQKMTADELQPFDKMMEDFLKTFDPEKSFID